MSSSNDSSSAAETCENCSSNFSLFKRKKVCNLCKQAFCQSCVNRQSFFPPLNNLNRNINNGGQQQQQHQQTSSTSSSSSSERICVICQSICSPHNTIDDLMKLKLKHLRSVLSTVNVPTNTCKEKRDLAELVAKNRSKFPNLFTASNNNSNNSSQQRQPQPNQQQQQQQPSSSSFNDTFNNFMSNVQDFVHFNINSALNNAQPAPAPPPPSASTSTSSSTANSSPHSNATGPKSTNNASFSSFTNFTGGPQPQPQSSSSSSASSSSMPSNLGSLFNLIGEQVPNVLQQTFNNNRFTFNNVFTSNSPQTETAHAENTAPSTTTSSSTPFSAPSSSSSSPPPPPPPSSTANQPSSSGAYSTGSGSYSNEPNRDSAPADAARLPKRRASLSDIGTEHEIYQLSAKQLKEILASNFVEYKGCVEKKELIDKVKRLYVSYLDNKRLERELVECGESTVKEDETANSDDKPQPVGATASAKSSKLSVDESDLCKICMESLIDCVLLDCGHMVACTKCGKRLAECPICRQNVVRVIRVFKS